MSEDIENISIDKNELHEEHTVSYCMIEKNGTRNAQVFFE